MFSRVTSSVGYIPQIDGLRALAVLLVVGHHVFAIYLAQTHRLGTQSLPPNWGLIWNRSAVVPWGVHLAFGVPIFFAISGFVLAMPFAGSILGGKGFPSTRLYLLRRLIRLEPPYVLCLTFYFAFILLPYLHPNWRFHVMLNIFGPHYLASLAYLHALIYGGPSWVYGNAWTLEIEVQFYLLMPLFAQVFRIWRAGLRRWLLAVAVLAAALFSQFGVPALHNPLLQWTIVGHLEFFFAGILLADLYRDPPKGLRLTPRVADLCALLGVALVVYALHWSQAMAWTAAFGVAGLFWGVLRGGWIGRVFSQRWLTVPGMMCYTIYLYHWFVIEHSMPLALKLLGPQHALWLDAAAVTLMMLPPILLMSAVLYLVTERPFVLLSHTATRRWRSVKMDAAAVPAVGA
jgi:peptidoglycan/LPS O-acetylase OafA/YrhL